jgi:hypothetical protein
MSPSSADDYYPDVDALYEERYEEYWCGEYDDGCPPDDWEDEDEDYEEEDDR